jgi:hypothetical protein
MVQIPIPKRGKESYTSEKKEKYFLYSHFQKLLNDKIVD